MSNDAHKGLGSCLGCTAGWDPEISEKVTRRNDGR